MKRTHLYVFYNFLTIVWKRIVSIPWEFYGWASSFRIDNYLSFVAAILMFIGTLVIVMDKFGPVHRIIDQFPKWRNISAAMIDLDTFDTKAKNGTKIGIIQYGSQGFWKLIEIIRYNRPDLKDEEIVSVAKNQPIIVGGTPFKIVHLAFKSNPKKGHSLTTEYIFYEWIKSYRERYFLKRGLFLIGLGFLLGVFGHIKRKN
jgi:hypothetical protein